MKDIKQVLSDGLKELKVRLNWTDAQVEELRSSVEPTFIIGYEFGKIDGAGEAIKKVIPYLHVTPDNMDSVNEKLQQIFLEIQNGGICARKENDVRREASRT